MNTKGAPHSIWNLPEDQEADATPPEINGVFDVLISGNNITAYTTALLLQRQGKKCAVAASPEEQEQYSYASFSTIPDNTYSNIEKKSGAATAHLVADALREAADQAEELITVYEIDCDFVYEPGFLFTMQDKEMVITEQLAAERAGLVTDQVHSIPVPVPFNAVCRFEFQARIHPAKYLSGLKKAFLQEGGTIISCHINTLKKGIFFEADTTAGTLQAHTVSGFDNDIKGIQQHTAYNMAFRLKTGTYPYGLAIHADTGFIFRHALHNNSDYIIASATGDDRQADLLKEYIQEHFDAEHIEFEWSSGYTTTPHGFPYIGTIPGQERRYITTGTGRNNLTWDTLAARIVADMILGRENACVRLSAIPAQG